jgi:hypothetical protein
MATDPQNNLRLEIGHILFIDLVGYSKLLIEEQKEWLRQLTEVVLATPRVAEASNEQLVRLPTGAGWLWSFAIARRNGRSARLKSPKRCKRTHP